MEEPNPYAPPQVESLAKPDPSSQLPADIRMLHRTHEASLRQGGLYYLITSSLGAVMFLPSSLVLFAMGLGPKTIAWKMVYLGLLYLTMFFLMILGIYVGTGLRQLKRRVIIPATISAVIWMLYFPFGTVVNIYLLYLLYSKKGKRILADDYKEIIAATPELNYNRDWELWAIIGVGIAVIAGALAIF